MTFDSRKTLLFIEKIERLFTFWCRRPAYSMTGPSGDSEYLYREGDHVLWICIEWLSGETGIDKLVYRDSVYRWDSPYHNEVISEEKRRQIFANVDDQFTREKSRYEWR